MLKRLLCLALVMMLALTLGGCRSSLESVRTASTLPPAASAFDAPTGDAALQYSQATPLYLPSRNGQRLLAVYELLSFSHGRSGAEGIARALLAHGATADTRAAGNGVQLGLFGPNPVEVSGGVCTVNLNSSALQLSHEDFYALAMSLATTLCAAEDVHYVNVLVADQAVGMDITGTLPLGSLTAAPGEELPVLWEQLEARRTPLGENPADTPLTSVATLYFPLADGTGVVAETRNLSFDGQSPAQLASGLLAALSAGPQYLSGVCDMPNIGLLMSAAPQVISLDDGGRMVSLYFHVNLAEMLRQSNVDLACFVSSLTHTLASYIPSVSSVRIYVGETPITSLYNVSHGSLLFPGGLIHRSDFSGYLMSQTTLYLSSGSRLKTTLRAMPCHDARSPRALMLRLMAGPTQQELDQGLEPVLPEGLTDADLLGVALVGDTLLVNLSDRCAELIRTEAAGWESVACYSMVNTLGDALGVKRVRFFFGGEVLEELGGTLYWGGEFLVNPGLIDHPLG